MDACPHCQRKLLSKASSRCNWCGEVIEDASYQQSAQVEREAFYRHEAERDAITLARTEAISSWDPSIGTTVFRPSAWRKPIPKSLDALTGGLGQNPGFGTSAYNTQPMPPAAGSPRFGTPLNNEVQSEPVDGNLARPWYADDTKSEDNRFTMRTADVPNPAEPLEELKPEDGSTQRTGRFNHLEIDQK